MCILFSCVRHACTIWIFEGTLSLSLSVCCTCCQTDGDHSENSHILITWLVWHFSTHFYHNLKQVLSLAGAAAPDSFKSDLKLLWHSYHVIKWPIWANMSDWTIALHCAVTLLLSRNATPNTPIRKMVKNHPYSHERVSQGAHYLHFWLIMVFLLMEFGVVVVCLCDGEVGGGQPDCREWPFNQGAGWAA